MSTSDNLRKAAKRWLKAIRDGNPVARARLARAYPGAPDDPTLRDIQHALARERGHENWIALTRAAAARAPEGDPLTALLLAAGRGEVETVAAILDRHPDLIDERGALPGNSGLRTALHFGSGHEPVVRTLLARGADPNIRDEGDNAYPLHFAAGRGDLAVVQLLVEHGADPVGAGTRHELDVLGWAVCFEYARHVEVARYLLAHGARHSVWSAAAMGDVPAIRELAAGGADLDARMDRTNLRRTPLHLAIVKKQPGAVAALIDLGADLNAQDAVGLTPLDQAALDGEDGMAELLIEAGARLTLPAAIVLDRPDDVERLVREDPELMSTTNNRPWARLLVHASGRAPGRVMEALLRTVTRHRAGLSIVNMEDDIETAVDGTSGYTPLHAAAFHGNDEAVAVLLAHGANPRTRDSRYCGTPAGWADYAGHAATARRILEADVDIFDAIYFDRADRVSDILDRDPDAIDRPFRAYARCEPKAGEPWPAPDATPLDWALAKGKTNAASVLAARGAGARSSHHRARADRLVTFLRSACWDEHVHGRASHRMHDRAAQRMVADDPWLARDSLYTAIVCGELDEVMRVLSARPEGARRRGGPRNWTPILYVAYTRFTHPRTIENGLTIARELLDRGADPNDFYLAGDARYSVLTGVAGEGEQDAPRQPYAAALFDLLLERGAEPYDVQVLYNTHFSGEMLWWLQLVHRRTAGTQRQAAWQDPEWRMFDMGGYGTGARFVLETALKTRNLPLAEWALAHGANPNAAPARDRRFPQRSLYEMACLDEYEEMAALLLRHGAIPTEPQLTGPEQFLQVCRRLDAAEARQLLSAHPEYLRMPDALFDAARRDRPDVLALLVELGFDLDLQNASGMRALHAAAAANAFRAAAFLVQRGADIDPRESTYGATPLGWAAHGDHGATMEVLSRHSRDLWILSVRGFVERIRELLSEDPSLARVTRDDGHTVLWWLPEDEELALELAEMLIRAGADPTARNASGETAADAAERRGMRRLAARLRAANAGI